MRLLRQRYAAYRPRSSDATDLLVTNHIRRDQERYLATLLYHPAEVKALLRQTRESIVVALGETVTDRMVCATFVVDQVYSALQNRAVSDHALGNPYGFLRSFDVGDGVLEAVVGIYIGEAELKGETVDRQREGHALQGEYMRTPLVAFVKQTGDKLYQEEVARLAFLLQQDPTGGSVVKDAVERLEAEANGKQIAHIGAIESFQIPAFVVAGAQFGQRVYEAVYPLAAEPKAGSK